MSDLLVIVTLVLSLTLTKTLADVSSLQDQTTNPEHLDPLNDQDQDLTSNNQDKRTICSAFKGCSGGGTASNVRHVIVKPIRHQLVGYAPVVRPVGLRPVVLASYKYPKPKVHFRLKAPSSLRPVFGGWNPMIQVVRPPGHVDVVHTKPAHHVDHVHASPGAVHVDHVHHKPLVSPVHVDQVHVRPVQPVQPVAVQGSHIDHVHQVTVPHGGHYDTFTHVDHIHQGAVPAVHPVVPVAAPPTVIKPFAPSPVLFEVTRPNLGVLPLGARFPHPILREVPHVHVKPAIPLAPAVPVAPIVPVAAPLEPVHHHHYHPAAVVPHQQLHQTVPTSIGFAHIGPQPGVSVEYHGTRNYLPLSGAVPFLHQTPINTVHPLPPTGFGVLPHQHYHPNTVHPLPQQPFEDAHHGFLTPQHLPHNHQAQGFLSPQQLPHDHQAQFSPEQLPKVTSPHFLQSQVQAAQQYQEIPQGQLPLEGEHNLDQFFQSNQDSFAPNSLNVQSFGQSNVIQPGQTDVQIPYHLPQHPGWESGASGFHTEQSTGLQEESRGFGDQIFRPSPQLEPPYNK